jgi:hypothetical protein
MPLVVASGAGAASQQAIGTAVVGGMIAATFMSLLFTPVFFVVMQKLSGLRKKKSEDEETSPNVTADAKQAESEKSA